MKPTICFPVDTRKQQPLTFGLPLRTDYFGCATARVATLKEPITPSRYDQAPLSIRLERKTLGDLYGSAGAWPISDAIIRRWPAGEARAEVLQHLVPKSVARTSAGARVK